MSKNVWIKGLEIACIAVVLTACGKMQKASVDNEKSYSSSTQTFIMERIYDCKLVGLYYDQDADCFHITNGNGLVELRNIVLGDSELFFKAPKYRGSKITSFHVVLDNDIDMADVKAWQPIPSFVGTFDGKGHCITNLLTEDETASLFVVVGQPNTVQTTIRNLTVEVCDVAVSNSLLCVAQVMNNVYMQDCKLQVLVSETHIDDQLQVALARTIYKSTVVHTQVLTLSDSYKINTLFGLYAHDVSFVGCLKKGNVNHDFIEKDCESCVYVSCVTQVNVRFRDKLFINNRSQSIAYNSFILPNKWKDIEVITQKLNEGCESWKNSRLDVSFNQKFYKNYDVVCLDK